MLRPFSVSVVLSVILSCTLPSVQANSPRWLTVPPTPSLPPSLGGYLSDSHGGKIWYSFFGRPLRETLAASESPVLFLHGGLAQSSYFGLLMEDLLDLETSLLAIDTRGHGR
jgi:pimeloyl-ACP methyl ester carboxylesterase